MSTATQVQTVAQRQRQQAEQAKAERAERTAEIERGLRLIHSPGDVLEIRALKVPAGRGYTITVSGYFDEFAKAAQAAYDCDRRGAAGVYVTLDPCNPALLARAPNGLKDKPEHTTSDPEILRRQWLFIDIDPHRPAGIAATEEELQTARDLGDEIEEKLRARGWPVPLIAESGNGGYRFWRVDLPNNDEALELVKRFYKGLNELLGTYDPSKPHAEIDVSVANAARIARVGGTTNRKGQPTPDRPHRRAQLFDPDLEYPVEVVPVEKIREVAELYKPEGKTNPLGKSSTNGSSGKLDVARYLTDRAIQFKKESVGGGDAYLIACPFNEQHGKNGETAVFQAASGLLTFECKHNGCTGKRWSDFRDAVGKPAERHWDRPPAPATPAAPAFLPVTPGTIVYATDKGGNFGDVVADLGDSCEVHFKNPDTGAEATVTLPKSKLRTGDGQRLDGGTAEPAREFKVYSMADLDALDLHVDMVIDRFRMVGAPGVVGGSFKTLKTSFALEEGLSMAIGPGTKYLDHFDVLRKAVSVYFAGEGGLVPLRETLRRQCRHKGVELRDVDGFFLCDEVPRLDSKADMEAIVGILRDRKAEFAYFDPCYLMFGAQAALAGNVYAMGTMFRPPDIAPWFSGISGVSPGCVRHGS